MKGKDTQMMQSGKYLRMIKHGNLVCIYIILVILLVGCGKTSPFEVQLSIVDKEIISEKTHHYVIENGEKKEIDIKKNQVPCLISSIKKNEKGIIAVSLSVWEGKPFVETPFSENTTERMSQAKVKYYVLFISRDSEKKYKEYPAWIDKIEWLDNNTLKVVWREKEEKNHFLKNPF